MKKIYQKISDFKKLKDFIFSEMWDRELSTLPRLKKTLYTFFRVIGVISRGATHDNIALHASSLTYISLMSMVPVLAVSFSVAKAWGAKEALLKMIGEKLSELPPGSSEVFDKVFMFVDKVNFSALGSFGLLFLIITVLKGMGSIESTFNTIWNVKIARSLIRKFSDYLSILIVVPILILTSTSVNALLSSNKVISFFNEKLGPLFNIFQKILSLSGLLSIILAFTFLYIFMPNTKVKYLPAFCGGIIGGVLWNLIQWAYIHFQIGVAKSNEIYGTFAAMPLFLVWLYMSWLVVLFGAEVAFAVQNFATYSFEQKRRSFSTMQTVAIIVLYDICKRFNDSQSPWDIEHFKENNKMPFRLLTDVMFRLEEVGLVRKVADNVSYLPAKNPKSLTMTDVENAFRGEDETFISEINDRKLQKAFDEFKDELEIFKTKLSLFNFEKICKE